jgi:hypothetical protein
VVADLANAVNAQNADASLANAKNEALNGLKAVE